MVTHGADRPGESTVEIHIPISPTPRFFTMLHYFAASARLFGGELATARIVVTVGADQDGEDLGARLPWSRFYPIEWSWLDRRRFQERSFYATAVDRFRLAFRSPVVMLLDADTLVVGSFEDLVRHATERACLAGVIAHLSPFLGEPQGTPVDWWERLFGQAGLGAPPLVCEHTAWGVLHRDPKARYCPPYFNLGVLVVPADLARAIGEVIYEEMTHVDRILDTHFKCQLALCLATCRLGIPWEALPVRYNFPNDPLMAKRYRDELEDVRLFHYLRVDSIDKVRDFQSVESVAALLARSDLEGVERLFQERLRTVHRQVLRDLAIVRSATV